MHYHWNSYCKTAEKVKSKNKLWFPLYYAFLHNSFIDHTYSVTKNTKMLSFDCCHIHILYTHTRVHCQSKVVFFFLYFYDGPSAKLSKNFIQGFLFCHIMQHLTIFFLFQKSTSANWFIPLTGNYITKDMLFFAAMAVLCVAYIGTDLTIAWPDNMANSATRQDVRKLENKKSLN